MAAAMLTDLIAGLGYGYIAQRGQFCLNSGYRHLLVRRDGTKFKAFVLAVALQMLVLPLFARLGWVQLTVPAFYPLGAVLGGYLFGLAMAWAGGCAAGVWYKWGAGDWASFLALLGLIFGAVLAERGPLRGLRQQVQALLTAEEIRNATLGGLLGGSSWD